MRNKNNFLSENDVYFSLEADFYIGFNVITPVYNFINGRLAAESAVLKPLL